MKAAKRRDINWDTFRTQLQSLPWDRMGGGETQSMKLRTRREAQKQSEVRFWKGDQCLCSSLRVRDTTMYLQVILLKPFAGGPGTVPLEPDVGEEGDFVDDEERARGVVEVDLRYAADEDVEPPIRASLPSPPPEGRSGYVTRQVAKRRRKESKWAWAW